jgi:tetratricopeptide (TPR) repeat protein
MTLTIVAVTFLIFVFVACLLVVKALKRARLKTSLKKKGKDTAQTSSVGILKKIVEKSPHDFVNRLKLAKLYIKAGDYSEAIFHINSLLTYRSNHPSFDEKELNRMLAECYVKHGDPEEAAKAYAVVLSLDPGDADAYARLGSLERKRNKADKAESCFMKALSLQPDQPHALKELGELLFEQKKYDQALAYLKKAHAVESSDPAVNFYLGEILHRSGSPAEAVPYFLKSRTEPRFCFASMYNLTRILRETSRYGEAVKVASTALQIKGLKREQTLALRYELGEAFLAQGQLAEAIEQWEKILAVSSNYKDVLAKMEKYEQTKSNLAMRAYMASSRSDFQNLCTKMIEKMLKNPSVIRAEMMVDSTFEVLVQVILHGVPTTMFFKFFRSSNTIGQFAVREFYEKLKEIKAKRGICLTNTEFSKDSYEFCDGRVLELVGKKKLASLVAKVA